MKSKSKIYVLSKDALFLQQLYSLCSQWDNIDIVELKQRKKLPKNLERKSSVVPLDSYRRDRRAEMEYNNNYEDYDDYHDYDDYDEYEGKDDYENSKVVSMAELEKQAIEVALRECRGNLAEMSRELGIGRATLYRKLKQYKLNPNNFRKKGVA